MSLDTLIVVDGNSLIHRAFHAIPLLSNSQGVVTNAVYGFTNMMLKILKEQAPGLVAVAFDKGKITFRHQVYADYKGTRKATPEELRPQFILAKEILKAMRIAYFEMEGYEADDLIGTIVNQAEATGLNVLILTGDRDALQLVSPKTKVILTKKGITETELFDEGKVWDKFGVTPGQIVDLKGLQGDPSDNIPGVPGVGEKTAVALLKEYGSVENILANLPHLSPRYRKLLQGKEEQALLSKKLATIMRDAPMALDLSQCSWRGPDQQKLLEIFKELEFKSLIKQLTRQPATARPADTARDNTAALPPLDTYQAGWQTVADQAGWDEILVQTSYAGRVALVLEGDRHQGIKAICLAVPNRDVCRLPVQRTDNPAGGSLNILKAVCENAAIKKYFHDAKAAIWLLHHHGIKLQNLAFDTMVAAYLLNPAETQYDLPDIALEHLGMVLPSEGEAALATRAEAVLRLVDVLWQKLAQREVDRLFAEVELPLVSILAEMEIAGVAVDKQGLKELSDELHHNIENLAAKIYELAGEHFNINSPKQLGHILFEKLKLPVYKKTRTGYSTDAEVLEKLAAEHEMVDLLLQYRQLAKLKSTYADGLAALVNRQTGCLHSTFHQTVTATGRLSSAEPNLQNIPIRLASGRRIRKVFIPRQQGNLILTADYSQIELRILAHMSQDKNFLEAFQQGQDIHTRTAAEVFGVSLDQVTPDMRSRAKAVNFGIVYGISDFGLARDLKVSRQEAKQYIESYFARCPGVRRYIDRVIKEARERGYVTTLLNRRRYLPELFSKNFNIRNFGERAAVNTPIQGSAADIIKLAMVKINQALKKGNFTAQMVLQVHDELIFDAPAAEIEPLIVLVRDCMENALPLDVPLMVDIKLGTNWYDTKPI
ncbi:DNA polymerase I [Desulforamulus hydrothermalis]|uniref:DNA polymerase I n=1 Tax=Desulforamulus hydrothermalis Lam5 = DSM 18033 TaxID=1121428 RepID=K8EEW2_9FIRM|nr:DNA polymerase I [Desulforamulus hydrothermalis]CCO07281.1 DNA polymerase I [Desulforamulus hydrothermalis Lam5 = DSM 18033]SHG93082.1 DNA polymerase I [Desulforamulus hydrothermalis Lam5 = DSM 18033]